MAIPYCTGPAFLYVGVPVEVASLYYIPTALPEAPYVIPAALEAVGALPLFVPGDGASVATKPPPEIVLSALFTFLRGYVPLYLGTGEEGVDMDFGTHFSPLYEDEAGGEVPSERIYEGQEAWIWSDINVYNELLYAYMASRTSAGIFSTPPFGVSAPRGIDLEGDVGTLMAAEGATFPLWVVFPYAGKARFARNYMPPGYRFFATSMENDKLPVGNKARKVRAVWYAQRVKAGGAWCLYDHNMSGISTPPN